eukprot:TRINITY_DN16900_c1_g1_i1.p1 TRINITY_DN16900_c1_g1~~TRINITY_DN16900_c1_g1_i1.p1  ORF type:complete len:370 (-),score=56.43 TRINITY_DN16900_c1_g1_i1:93-1202(-)
MGNTCKQPSGCVPCQTATGDEHVNGQAPYPNEEVNCLGSQKLSCFQKKDSFGSDEGGSEVSTPGPRFDGYVAVTPVSGFSNEQSTPDLGIASFEQTHFDLFADGRQDGFIGEEVYLHLYDLNDTLSRLNSVSLDLLGVGCALHVGVEVLGKEWSFGMKGVSIASPKHNEYYTYRMSVPMGKSVLQRKDIEITVQNMRRKWSGINYEIFHQNCGSFCNELCERLGVGRMPSWVTRLAETMATLPGSRSLASGITRATVPNLDDGPCSPEILIAGEDEAYLDRSPRGGRSAGLRPPSGSPVRCRLGASPGKRQDGPLPRAKCEAFRVYEEEEKARKVGKTSAPADRDGSVVTDKYGNSLAPRKLQFAAGGC